jgi:hypothetical protein
MASKVTPRQLMSQCKAEFNGYPAALFDAKKGYELDWLWVEHNPVWLVVTRKAKASEIKKFGQLCTDAGMPEVIDEAKSKLFDWWICMDRKTWAAKEQG